ncbi:hypothetical protein KQI86_08765 [Clostridium sp. MSJ-11]|uniref:Uncharacterized protein n=1 Tax=Clostridium mobile TaxID=2841512 RepID=A0ABS6EGT1_9CLOT|nr:hypothetical protein [Clostridium mobile]MBU5484418.1 hypothetical protein [Clostridium mobile]
MKKDKTLMISLTSIILFNVFFIIILICYNDIIILPIKFIKNVTKEYYYWYMDRPPIPNESIVIGITTIVKMMFSLILSLEFFYTIFNKKYANVIDKKNIVISIIIGFTIYCLSFLFIKYKAQHYRLFMTLISTEILSMMLLNLVLKIKKEKLTYNIN